METFQHWIMVYGYAGLFVFLMAGIVGVPLPEDLMLACAGYLIFKGCLNPWPTYAAAFFGSVCGITVSYFIGRYLGYSVIAGRGYRFGLSPAKMAKVMEWYSRFGKWTLTFGYYVGGVRHVNALVAGALKLRFPSFALFAYVGAFIWSVSLISAGYLLGKDWAHISGHIGSRVALIVTVAAIVAAYFFHKNRRAKREDQAQTGEDPVKPDTAERSGN